MRPLITLTTDFGTRDSYVGTMKGIILGLCPDALLVDLTHEIPPQDILTASWVLNSAFEAFPPQTIHLVVIDPGVGTTRQPLALATPLARLVGPDNGVLSRVWEALCEHCAPEEQQQVALTASQFWRTQHPSNTFHGRDIFAPVAAHLANGVPLLALGKPLNEIVKLPPSAPYLQNSQSLIGKIVYIDHFGNAISNISALELEKFAPLAQISIFCKGNNLGSPKQTYMDVSKGLPLALFSSSGDLEIAVREGNARQTLGLTVGMEVECRREEELGGWENDLTAKT